MQQTDCVQCYSPSREKSSLFPISKRRALLASKSSLRIAISGSSAIYRLAALSSEKNFASSASLIVGRSLRIKSLSMMRGTLSIIRCKSSAFRLAFVAGRSWSLLCMQLESTPVPRPPRLALVHSCRRVGVARDRPRSSRHTLTPAISEAPLLYR